MCFLTVLMAGLGNEVQLLSVSAENIAGQGLHQDFEQEHEQGVRW